MHPMFATEAYHAHFGREGAEERAEEARRLFADVGDLVAWAEGLEPGPELFQVLTELADVPMDHGHAIAVAALWARFRSWVEAQELAATARAAGQADPESDAWIAADLAATAHISERAVAERMSLMRRVSAGLPLCWEALNAGEITMSHLRAIDAVTEEAAPELAQQVETEVLPKAIAREWTPSRLRDAARKALLKLDANGARERAARAKVRRSDVKLYGDENDMASLVATGDAWTNRRVMDEINRRADALKRAGDKRTLGELKFASLAAALLNVPAVRSLDTTPPTDATDDSAGPATCHCSGRPGRSTRTPKRAQAIVTIDLATLMGLRNNPGDLSGYGAITAAMARGVAADASLRLLVLSPVDGKPVGQGRNSYHLDAESRRWLDVRDRECLFPGCRRQAIYCDADHADEWDAGGETSCENCGLLCRRHHNFKTSKAWDVTRHEDDTVTWRSPYGHEFTVGPEPYDLDPGVADAPALEDAEVVTLPEELATTITDDEWRRRWQSWVRAG